MVVESGGALINDGILFEKIIHDAMPDIAVDDASNIHACAMITLDLTWRHCDEWSEHVLLEDLVTWGYVLDARFDCVEDMNHLQQWITHGVIRKGVLTSQRYHSYVCAVVSPVARAIFCWWYKPNFALWHMPSFRRSRGHQRTSPANKEDTWFNIVTSHPLGWTSREIRPTKWPMSATSNGRGR